MLNILHLNFANLVLHVYKELGLNLGHGDVIDSTTRQFEGHVNSTIPMNT